MHICGLQKLAMVDFPGKLAATVFTGGCNLRCPFCHNASLVLPEKLGEFMSEEEFFSFLRERQGVLEGVLLEGVKEKTFFVTDVEGSAQLLLRLYLTFTDEAAFLLAQEENEDRLMDALVGKLNLYRTAIERVLVAPFGSVVLFEAKELQLLAQQILRDRVRRRADAMLMK